MGGLFGKPSAARPNKDTTARKFTQISDEIETIKAAEVARVKSGKNDHKSGGRIERLVDLYVARAKLLNPGMTASEASTYRVGISEEVEEWRKDLSPTTGGARDSSWDIPQEWKKGSPWWIWPLAIIIVVIIVVILFLAFYRRAPAAAPPTREGCTFMGAGWWEDASDCQGVTN
jgi:hypothetical protein